MIVITIDGGLVQGISSDEPKLVGQEVIVIDYDAEGADAGEVQKVPQGKGKTEDAVVSRKAIGVLFKPIAQFVKKGNPCSLYQ